MWARTFYFTDTEAYHMIETMKHVQATMEMPLLGTDPGIWTWEQRQIYSESQAFSVAMWDFIYANDIDPNDFIWDPLAKCHVHIELFFKEHGIEAVPTILHPQPFDDALSLEYSDSGTTVTVTNVNDLPEVIDLTADNLEILAEMNASSLQIGDLLTNQSIEDMFDDSNKEN